MDNYYLGHFVWDPDLEAYVLIDKIPVDISDDDFEAFPDFIFDFDISDLLNFDEEI